MYAKTVEDHATLVQCQMNGSQSIQINKKVFTIVVMVVWLLFLKLQKWGNHCNDLGLLIFPLGLQYLLLWNLSKPNEQK